MSLLIENTVKTPQKIEKAECCCKNFKSIPCTKKNIKIQ
jgi:hypothetical protein